MIERDELRRRCIAATAETIACARRFIVEPLPDLARYDLWLVPIWSADGKPEYDPELAALWQRSQDGKLAGLLLERFIDEIWHGGKAPEWIDLAITDEDGKYTYVEARMSRRLVPWFTDPAPFNVRGPYIPPRMSGGDRIVGRWSLHDPELALCRCFR